MGDRLCEECKNFSNFTCWRMKYKKFMCPPCFERANQINKNEKEEPKEVH